MQTYQVRILSSETELTQAFQLRYDTYKIAFPLFLKCCSFPLECDVFDSSSIHLGLYAIQESKEQLIGYCRMVIPPIYKPTYQQYFLQHHEMYPPEVSEMRMQLLEKIKDEISFNKLNIICKGMETDNIVYAEMSRFIIQEKHRSLSLSLKFLASFYAINQMLGIRRHIFSCNHTHGQFYTMLGFKLIEDIGTVYLEDYAQMLVFEASAFNLPEKLSTNILDFNEQLIKINSICFCK